MSYKIMNAETARKMMIDLSDFYVQLEKDIIDAAIEQNNCVEYVLNGNSGAGIKPSDMAKTISQHRERIERHLISLGYRLNWEGMRSFVIYWDKKLKY